MADVDRGQILILTGLLLAVVFVGLALVMNSAIYAENIATRDTGSDTREVLQQRQMLEEHLAETVDRTNSEVVTTNGGDLESELEKSVNNQSRAHALTEATHGTNVDVQISDTAEGTRLRQTDATRNFNSANGDGNWTLSSDIPEDGQVAMTVNNDSLFDATLDTTMAVLAESAFVLEFPTASGTWRIYLFNGAASDSVYAVVEEDDQDFQDETLNDRTNPDHVVDGWLNQTCSLQGETVTLRLEKAEFGGTHCEPFEFYGELGDHEMRFNNTQTAGIDRATGTYDILLGTSNFNTAAFEPVGSGQPYYQSAMYSFNYSYTYETSTTTFEAPNRTVKPKEKDPGGILWDHPTIERFDVENNSGATTAEFEVDWRVEDRNAELAEVDIELIERSVDKSESEIKGDVEGAIDDPAYDEFLNDEYSLLPGDPASNIIDAYMDDYTNLIATPINTAEVVDRKEITVSGADASGTDTVGDSTVGTNYYVKITVSDSSGRSTTRVKACDASGCEEVA